MTSSRYLLLETSSQPGLVALAEDNALLGVRRLDEARRHARDLAPTVAELFAAHGWQPRDVGAVLTTRGPGSYTGLRVGLMSAKAFAYATGCAVVALETFAVIAAQAPFGVLQLAVLADAQQDKVYVQEFAGQPLVATAPLTIRPLTEWLQLRKGPWWLSGPGLRKLRGELPANITLLKEALWDPQPETLLRLGGERHQRGEMDDLWAVEPLYLRPSAAEEQWARRQV